MGNPYSTHSTAHLILVKINPCSDSDADHLFVFYIVMLITKQIFYTKKRSWETSTKTELLLAWAVYIYISPPPPLWFPTSLKPNKMPLIDETVGGG